MWVRVPEWTIVDGAVPDPRVGELLLQTGLRVEGEVSPALPDSPDGISEVVTSASDPGLTRYRVAGTVTGVRDVIADFGGGPQVVAVEFVVACSGVRLQAHVKAGSPIEPDTRVSVEGSVSVVGDYEWDGFDLVDTRADWQIREVAPSPQGDVMLDLVH